MSNKTKTQHALLLGATGLIGGMVLSRLLADNHYGQVTIVVRRKLDISHAKLTQLVVNFAQLETLNEQLKCDDVYCCLGTTLKVAGSQEAFRRVDFDYCLNLAKITQTQGARQFLLISSLGADPQAKNFYLSVKGQLEQALQQLDYPSLQLLRPSLLLGKRSQTRVLEDIGQTLAPLLNRLLVGPLRKYRAIKAQTVADCMVELAKQNKSGINIYESDKLAP